MITRLRHLAQVNPSTPAFDRLPSDAEITFMPLETVWADHRLDTSRTAVKSDVSSGYVRFQEGDVLVPKTAPTFQHGRSAVASGLVHDAGAGSSELHILRAKPHADARFLSYVVRSGPFIAEGVTAYQGVAGLQRVNADFVADWPVLDASLDMQQRIADFLDEQVGRLEQIVIQRSRQLALLLERKAALLESVMTRLRARNPVVPLRRLAQGIEQGASPECSNQPTEDGYGVLKVSAIRFGRYRPEENKALPIDTAPDLRYLVHPGDLLVTRGSGSRDLVGDVAVATHSHAKLLLPDLIYRVRLLPEVNPSYACAALLSHHARGQLREATRGAVGGTIKLRGSDVLDTRIADVDAKTAASVAVQVEHAFSEIDGVSSLISKSAELAAERKQALITAAVSGQLDVTTARSVA